MVPYKVVAGPSGDARVSIPANGKTYTPQEISAMILGKLKADAEAYLGVLLSSIPVKIEPQYYQRYPQQQLCRNMWWMD
jgi:molecular chaperone DnaK